MIFTNALKFNAKGEQTGNKVAKEVCEGAFWGSDAHREREWGGGRVGRDPPWETRGGAA